MTTNHTNYDQKQPEVGNFCNLTEQWKKGELEQGWYYVQLIRGEYRIDLYIKDKNEWIDCPDAIIDAVVCAVPSYEEWQSLNELLDSMRDTNKALAHKLNNIKVNGNYPDKISKLKSRIKGLLEENEKLKKWCEEFNALDVANENQQLKEEIKKLKEAIYYLDGLECPKCGNYHRRGWTCSQCGYGK